MGKRQQRHLHNHFNGSATNHYLCRFILWDDDIMTIIKRGPNKHEINNDNNNNNNNNNNGDFYSAQKVGAQGALQ